VEIDIQGMNIHTARMLPLHRVTCEEVRRREVGGAIMQNEAQERNKEKKEKGGSKVGMNRIVRMFCCFKG
jgi:hypothetical protein